MKSMTTSLLGAALVAASMAPAWSAERGSKEEAISLTKKVIVYYKTNGKEKTIAEVNNKSAQFIDRDLYVIIIDAEGKMLANGANEKMVGKPLLKLTDGDGKNFAADMVAVVKSGKSGWVDYRWPNASTQKIESKSTYIETFDNLGFGVGIYK